MLQAQEAMSAQARHSPTPFLGVHHGPVVPALPDSWLANYYLDMITQIHQDPVHPDFSIYGSDLLVQMHYVEADFLQVSVTILVYQLTLLMFASRSDTFCPWQAPSSMWGLAASSKNYLLCS